MILVVLVFIKKKPYGPYNIRKLGKVKKAETNEEEKAKLVNFYTLNFPSFIEVLLNQNTDNFNSKTPERQTLFYSENQFSDINNQSLLR